MTDDMNELKQLLIEIGDAQREALIVSRRVAEESLENQRQAMQRQEQAAKLVRRVVVFALIVITGIIIFLVKLRMENYHY